MSAQPHHNEAQRSDATPTLLALLELARRAREAADVAELGFIAVNETRGVLHYRQAALWVSGTPRGVLAVSGVAQPDPSAPYVQWLHRLMKSSEQSLPQPKRLHAGDLAPLVGEEWGQWLPRDALLVPLQGRNGQVLGILLIARDGTWQDHELTLATELGHIYGHALRALQPREGSLARLLAVARSRKWLVRALLGLLVIACLPVRLSVLMPAEVTPVDAFVVRAPLDGVIDRVEVQPNQNVAAGASLFKLDTTALASRYASAREALETAREQYRQSAQLAVTDDRAKLEMALQKGALEQKSVDLAYTESQLQRVQVKADRAGVAVFSDARDWIGRAVNIGEKVMVIADPARVELTARMPVSDQINVQPGAEIVFYPQATPFASYRAIVDSVAYRAEATEENVLVYRIRAHFVGGASPRLGLMGSARAYAHRVPLVYKILRRPLGALRQWIGW